MKPTETFAGSTRRLREPTPIQFSSRIVTWLNRVQRKGLSTPSPREGEGARRAGEGGIARRKGPRLIEQVQLRFQIAHGRELPGSAALLSEQEPAIRQVEQIGARRLVDDVVTHLVRLDRVAMARML